MCRPLVNLARISQSAERSQNHYCQRLPYAAKIAVVFLGCLNLRKIFGNPVWFLHIGYFSMVYIIMKSFFEN